MSFIVVGYYTKNSIYETHAKKLIASLRKLSVNHDIAPIENQGSWDKNTHYKPGFILRMLDKYPDMAVVYNDVDSEFLQYPKLFDELSCDVAVHLLDHALYHRRKVAPEVLSGTIYFGNTNRAREIIGLWQTLCNEQMLVWDQALLQLALGDEYYKLPPQYCVIHDYMKEVTNKVVVHYQASREQKLIEKFRRS